MHIHKFALTLRMSGSLDLESWSNLTFITLIFSKGSNFLNVKPNFGHYA